MDKEISRINIIQDLINKEHFSNYLEIGTFEGDSFLPIKCKNKVAVDPKFKIARKNKIKWCFRNLYNLRNRYFEMPSDEFFNKKDFLLKGWKPEIIFIDGLHTFKASLLDTLNSINLLSENGYIILHDCFPPNEAAATPATSIEEANSLGIPGWKMEWCGDVWKTILYLKEEYADELHVMVINTDYGLGIIRKKSFDMVPFELNMELYNTINSYNYNYLSANPEILLNLKSVEYFDQYSL